MHPAMREDALAERRREVLSGTDHRLHLTHLTEARTQANKCRNDDLDRDVRLRVWLLHQLTWRRRPRAAMDEA
jgi:hypothetical protein